MELRAKELAEILKGTVEGNPEEKVTSFAKIENGKPGQLCFYANPKYEQYVYTSKASIIRKERTMDLLCHKIIQKVFVLSSPPEIFTINKYYKNTKEFKNWLSSYIKLEK